MRIGGLASGIDTESIINDLMKAQRIPLDKVTQKKQQFEWKLDDLRSANRKIEDLRAKMFSGVILSSNFSAKKVSVSSPNDVEIVSKGNIDDFSGTIRIQQLATNASAQGKEVVEQSNRRAGTITIEAPNGEPINVEIKANESIDDIIKNINNNTDVRAFFDSSTGRIGMTAKKSGGDQEVDNKIVPPPAESYIRISGDSDVLSDLGLDNLPVTGNTAGKNSVFTYNGMEMERASNKFDLDGMEITLKAVNTQDITFNATTDTDKVFNTVKQFVDDYNGFIEEMNKKVREPVYRSFQPLSSEQKAEMKEKEIEQWEEKAKSGSLRNDSELTNMLTDMRNILSKSVGEDSEGNAINLASMGITTSKNYLDRGKLVIDETKLKEMITKDPDQVRKLFKNEETEPAKQGLAQQLRDRMYTTRESINSNAGKAGDGSKNFKLGRTLDDMNKQIERFETKMKTVENRYWKQFTAMENAIQRANMQSANLMNSLGGGA